jgi:hypothetical protein
MGYKCPRPSFETPRKGAAPQDDGGMRVMLLIASHHDTSLSSGALMQRDQ